MIWVSCKLGDIINLKRGYDLPNAKRIAGEIPVVSSSGISGSHNEAKVASPAVVTGRYGTLGKVYYVDKDCWPLNTALYVQNFKGNRPKFIYYFLQSVLKGMQSDKAAVPGVNRNDLHARQVMFPEDEKQQESIEDLLTPYDDLIENNQRRIQLKSLIRSKFSEDSERFFSIALQVAAHEDRQGHKGLAHDIRDIIDAERKKKGPRLLSFPKNLQGSGYLKKATRSPSREQRGK